MASRELTPRHDKTNLLMVKALSSNNLSTRSLPKYLELMGVSWREVSDKILNDGEKKRKISPHHVTSRNSNINRAYLFLDSKIMNSINIQLEFTIPETHLEVKKKTFNNRYCSSKVIGVLMHMQSTRKEHGKLRDGIK